MFINLNHQLFYAQWNTHTRDKLQLINCTHFLHTHTLYTHTQYKKYQEKSFIAFQEKDIVPKCQKCQSELDMSQRQEAEVFTPASFRQHEATPTEAGGAWVAFIKLFKKSQSPPTLEKEQIRTRRQIKCNKCLVGIIPVWVLVSI